MQYTAKQLFTLNSLNLPASHIYIPEKPLFTLIMGQIRQVYHFLFHSTIFVYLKYNVR